MCGATLNCCFSIIELFLIPLLRGQIWVCDGNKVRPNGVVLTHEIDMTGLKVILRHDRLRLATRPRAAHLEAAQRHSAVAVAVGLGGVEAPGLCVRDVDRVNRWEALRVEAVHGHAGRALHVHVAEGVGDLRVRRGDAEVLQQLRELVDGVVAHSDREERVVGPRVRAGVGGRERVQPRQRHHHRLEPRRGVRDARVLADRHCLRGFDGTGVDCGDGHVLGDVGVLPRLVDDVVEEVGGVGAAHGMPRDGDALVARLGVHALDARPEAVEESAGLRVVERRQAPVEAHGVDVVLEGVAALAEPVEHVVHVVRGEAGDHVGGVEAADGVRGVGGRRDGDALRERRQPGLGDVREGHVVLPAVEADREALEVEPDLLVRARRRARPRDARRAVAGAVEHGAHEAGHHDQRTAGCCGRDGGDDNGEDDGTDDERETHLIKQQKKINKVQKL
eukprot:PhM_4_TR15659/c2_g1_i3/m.61391